MFKLKNFSLKELFSKTTYEKNKEEDLIKKLDLDFFKDVDDFCTDVKTNLFATKVNCNTWAFGGDFNERGFRDTDSDTGTATSQHRFGKAIDLEFFDKDGKEIITEKIIEFLIKRKKEGKYKHISRVELGTGWLHLDTKAVSCSLYGFHISDSTKSRVLVV